MSSGSAARQSLFRRKPVEAFVTETGPDAEGGELVGETVDAVEELAAGEGAPDQAVLSPDGDGVGPAGGSLAEDLVQMLGHGPSVGETVAGVNDFRRCAVVAGRIWVVAGRCRVAFDGSRVAFGGRRIGATRRALASFR